jgi:hypothetical protein
MPSPETTVTAFVALFACGGLLLLFLNRFKPPKPEQGKKMRVRVDMTIHFLDDDA